MKKILTLLLLSLFLVSCGGSSDITQKGYLKNEANNRIKVLSYASSTIEEIKESAKNQMNTERQTSWSYYYDSGKNITDLGSSISTTNDFSKGQEIVSEFQVKPNYIGVISYSGEFIFSDCSIEGVCN